MVERTEQIIPHRYTNDYWYCAYCGEPAQRSIHSDLSPTDCLPEVKPLYEYFTRSGTLYRNLYPNRTEYRDNTSRLWLKVGRFVPSDIFLELRYEEISANRASAIIIQNER